VLSAPGPHVRAAAQERLHPVDVSLRVLAKRCAEQRELGRIIGATSPEQPTA